MSITGKIIRQPIHQDLKVVTASLSSGNPPSTKPANRTAIFKLASKVLIISSAASCLLAGCNGGNSVESPLTPSANLFSGGILSVLSDDAALVGRILISSKPGQKFMAESSLFNRPKSSSSSDNNLNPQGTTPNSLRSLSESFNIGEIEELVNAVDKDGTLKDELADFAFAVVPGKSVANPQTKRADTKLDLGVEIVAKFNDNVAKTRIDRIVTILQKNGTATRQLAFDGCDISVSFTHQMELADPSQQLRDGVDAVGLSINSLGKYNSDAMIPNELKSNLKNEFEISIGSQGGLLFAASDSNWIKEQCGKKDISHQSKTPQLLQSTASQELINSIHTANDSFSFIMASPSALVKAATPSVNKGQDPEPANHLSQNLPEAVLFTQHMPDSLINRLNISASKLPEPFNAGLNGDINPLLNHISDKSIVSISLSGDLLRAVAKMYNFVKTEGETNKLETAIKEKLGKKEQRNQVNSRSTQGIIPEQLSPYLMNNKGVSISITSIAADKMFPGLAIIFNDTQSDKLKERFKRELPGLLGDTASMLPPFQTKSSGGINIDYSITPFGVGLYLANKDDLMIVATEEELLASLVHEKEAGSNSIQSGSSILASLEPTFKKELQGLKNTAFFNLDFNRLAAAISSAENTTSMFTGGKGLVSPEQLRTIKEMGKIAGRLTLANGIISFVQSKAYPPKTP